MPSSGSFAVDLSLYSQQLIEDTPYYISSSGDDDSGDGSSVSPWATPHKAMEVIRRIYLPDYITASIIVKDGEVDLSGQDDLSIVHPQGKQIVLKGENKHSKSFTSVVSVSGSAGNYTVTFACSDTSNVAVGDDYIVKSASGGTNPEQTLGPHKVTGVSENTSIEVLSKNLGTLQPSGAVSGSGVIIKSRLNFGANKLDLQKSAITLEDIAFEGTSTVLKSQSGSVTFSDFASRSSGIGIDLVDSEAFGNISAVGTTAGFRSWRSKGGDLSGSIFSSGSFGLIMQMGGLLRINNIFAVGNVNGVSADNGAVLIGNLPSAIGNTAKGFTIKNGSQGYLQLIASKNNGTYGLSVENFSNAQIASFYFVSGNGSGSFSPSLNTLGNNNSLISEVS